MRKKFHDSGMISILEWSSLLPSEIWHLRVVNLQRLYEWENAIVSGSSRSKTMKIRSRFTCIQKLFIYDNSCVHRKVSWKIATSQTFLCLWIAECYSLVMILNFFIINYGLLFYRGVVINSIQRILLYKTAFLTFVRMLKAFWYVVWIRQLVFFSFIKCRRVSMETLLTKCRSCKQ